MDFHFDIPQNHWAIFVDSVFFPHTAEIGIKSDKVGHILGSSFFFCRPGMQTLYHAYECFPLSTPTTHNPQCLCPSSNTI